MSSQIRILYLDEVSAPGGGGHSLHLLMRHLDPRFEPVLVGPPGAMLDKAQHAGIRTHAYEFTHRYESMKIAGREIPLNPASLFRRLADARRLAALARREEADIIHTNNLDAHLTGWFLRHVYGLPVVWHIRTNWPRSFYKGPWPTRIVFVSHAVRDRALGARRTDRRALVVHNGINPPDFVAPADSRGEVLTEFHLPARPLVGIVGRLSPWKRHDLFLRAASIATASGVHATWMIIGGEIENRSGGGHAECLHRLAQDLGIADRVVFTGHRSDIPRLVSALDVLVLASDHDPNPRTILEAMVLERPIVATRSGGVPEMVADGQEALLVERGDEHALADAVVRLLGDAALRRCLAQRAKARVHREFSAETHARRIERVYDEVLQERASGR